MKAQFPFIKKKKGAHTHIYVKSVGMVESSVVGKIKDKAVGLQHDSNKFISISSKHFTRS